MASNFFIASGSEDQMINAIHQGGEKKNSKNKADRSGKKVLAIMLHGYPGNKSGHGDLFGTLASELAAEYIDTIRFDYRGCGESGGRPESFSFASASNDVTSVLGWAKESGYNAFFFIAEGLGAPIALMNIPKNLRGMMFLWPALDPRHTRTLRQALSESASRVSPSLLKDIVGYNPPQALQHIDLPLLVQHGDEDEEISPIQLELLRRHATSDRRIELTTYEGGTHGLPEPNHREAACLHIARFIRRYA